MNHIRKYLIAGALTTVQAYVIQAQPGDSSFFAFDRFGRRFNVDQLIMSPPMALMGGGGCTSAGIFNLDFTGDPGFTPARQAVACQVFSDLSALLIAADDPYENAPNPSAFVNIRFLDFTAFLPPPPPNALAAASSFFSWLDVPQDEPNLHSIHDDYRPIPLMNGVVDGQVWKTINGGYDAWYCHPTFKFSNVPDFFAHGYTTVNWNAPLPWFLGPNLPVPAGQYDLYTVLAHEAMHMLGFASGMDANLDCVFAGSEYVFRFDTHLSQNGTSLVNDPVLCDDNSWTGNLSGAFNATPGNCTTEILGIPVFAPASFEPGSSLSHFDGTCNGGVPFLMHPNVNNPAGQSRIPLQQEGDVLFSVDYRTSAQYGVSGSGWDGTVDPRSPCGSRLAGVDDIWVDYATHDFYRVAQGGSITIDNFLDNDEDMATVSGEPEGFDCLVVEEGGSITAQFNFPDPNPRFTFLADPGFVGWGRVSYRPKNFVDGRTGNITHVFIHIWPSPACDVPDCNILNGGTFESVAFRNGNVAPHDSYHQGGGNSPDLFAYEPDGFPLSTIGLRPPGWYDFNSLTAPSRVFSRCTNPGELYPPSWNGAPANVRYAKAYCSTSGANLSREGLLFELCRPLVPGYTYTIEYKGKNGGPCSGDWSFYAFEDRPCNPTQGTTSFTGPNPCGGAPAPYLLPLPSSALTTLWSPVSNTFTYSAAFSSDFLIARSPVATGPSANILIDDLVVRPVITASADIDPSCIGQATGQIALDVHYYPGSYSILWSNGATTATITGLAAGSYTVTITDTELGCATLTETYNVGDVPCSNAFILTKTVNDEFTYSGAPILYTITVCNGTATTQDVELTDSGLSNFVHTSIALNGAPFAWPGFPSSPVTLPNVPAGGCATLEVSGYFTAIGTYTNCATADPANEDPVSNCAEPVVVQQNCPLMVSGWGDCVNGPVHLCLSEHSLIVDIKTLDFRWIFPEFLAPPTLGGAIVPVAASGLDPASSISAELPWTSMPGWSYVEVHLVFNNAISTAGSSTLLCVDVNYDGPVTPLQNVFQTFATNAAPYTINNHVTLLDGGGAPIQPGGFWTQAANIILTGCPGIEGPDASFTIDQVLCTGEVSVNGSLTDPNAIHMWTWGDERTTPTNGAQSYTYNYFEAIPLNQTPAYSVPPAPPGTYTITHTVILNGVASSSTQTVTLYACCQADQVITHGKLASAVPGPLTGTVDIQGQFILDQDFTFDNATVYMEPGAEILVQDGINLWVNESTIESCQDVLWKGITTGDGCIVQVRYSTIADAEHGIQARNSSIVLADESEFKNNRVGIEVPFVNQFNSVAIHSANCTYHAEGPLKQPYPGQVTAVGATGYAALDVNNMSLDFTGGGNVIRDLSNGIVGFRSDLNVADCSIHDIKPDAAYEHYANGSGIYARGPKAFRTLKQYGYGQSGAPSFQNCHWGIYAEHMNVYSWDNNMVNVGTAYRVDRSGYKDVHIHHNTVDTRRDGIVLHMNDGAAQVLVESNDITFAQNLPIGQYTKGYYAIRVFEANTLNPNSVIKNNIIHYRPGVTTAYGGIGLVSARKYLVANNALHMSDNASNYVGVLLNGCDDPEVSCNEVFGANNGYPNLGQSGVRNFMGNNAIISCNTVDNTTNGMLFSGWAINTDLKGNEFNNHRWGLHLENGAVIGTQTRTGNLWNQPAPQNGWQAWHENATDASQHKFYFDPTVPNTEPPSHEPIYWFQQDPGQTYSCAPGVNYCDQFGERCVGCPKEIYERIADGTLENGDYTDQTRWTMKGDLYDILKEAPQLRNDPELEAFYNTVQSTVLAAQKDMNDERIALYDIDASVLGQVVQNREQLLVLQGELKLALEQLAAPDLTAAQRTTLNGVITGLQQTMDGLISYNTAALELAANTRALSAESVKNTNAAIGATELTETNYKTVHAIYLSTVAKDVEGFTAQQAQDLLAVADQCPLVGGNAVFQARALYYAIDPEQEFDDPALCLQHGLVTKSLKQPVVNALSMVPNPAMDEVTLVLTAALEEAGTLLICNAQGAEVLRLRVPKDQQRTAVSVATLAPGVYHYRVLGVTGDLGAGKLSIVR